MKVSLLLALIICIKISFSQDFGWISDSYYMPDICWETGVSSSSIVRCVDNSVMKYNYFTNNCGGEASASEAFAGELMGGCDQFSGLYYNVLNCSNAKSNVASVGTCNYWLEDEYDDPLPLSLGPNNPKCLNSNCKSGANSCYYLHELEDDGNFTVVEKRFNGDGCNPDNELSNFTYFDNWLVLPGDKDCFVQIDEYSFDEDTYYCHYEDDDYSSPKAETDCNYMYYDPSTFSESDQGGAGDTGVIYYSIPITPNACYGVGQGFMEYSYKYVCDKDSTNVELFYYLDSYSCGGKNFYSASNISIDNVTIKCNGKTCGGKYDTQLWFTESLNGHATRYSGQLPCDACFHKYFDFADRVYYESNLMSTFSTVGPGQNFLTQYWYIDTQCSKPVVFQFDILGSSSFPYAEYKVSGCKNKKQSLGKKLYKVIYGDGYFNYWD